MPWNSISTGAKNGHLELICIQLIWLFKYSCCRLGLGGHTIVANSHSPLENKLLRRRAMRLINIKWFYWLSAAIALWFRFELDWILIYRLCFRFGARTSQRANYVGMSHCIRRGIQIQYQAHNNKWNRRAKKKIRQNNAHRLVGIYIGYI